MIQETQQSQYKNEDLIIRKMLGEGSFAKVYTAYYKGEKVAVKQIKNPQNKTFINTYKKEIEILETLRHRRLIQLLGHNKVEQQKDGFIQTQYNIILEYAPNGNLFQYMKVLCGFNEQICRYYFKQLLEVLFYLQNQQICHRDIKLENILLDENYDLKLADFGLAKKVADEGILNEFQGNPSYTAPEIFNKRPYNGFKTDIFSLGILLFTLYAGYNLLDEKQKMRNENLLGLIKNKQNEQFWSKQCQRSRKDQSFYSDDFKNLIEGMIHPDPNLRFTLDECQSHVWRNGETATKEQIFQEMSRRDRITTQATRHNRSCYDEKVYYEDVIKVYKLKFENWQLEKGQIEALQNQIIINHDVKTVICELIFKIQIKNKLGYNIEIDQQKCQLKFEVNMNQLDNVEVDEYDLQEQQIEQQDQQDYDEMCIIQQNLKIMIELQKTEQNLIILNVWKLQGDCLMFLNAFNKLQQIIKNI